MARFTYQDKEKKNGQVPASQSVQVVDFQKRPLAVLSLAQVRRQKLYHQFVYLLSFTNRQKISLEPITGKGKTYWELSGVSPVGPGESSFSTAERIGELCVGKDILLTRHADFLDEDSCQFLEVYRFSFFPGKLSPGEENQRLCLDRFEFERIFIDFPSMLGPSVSRLWQLGILFNL